MSDNAPPLSPGSLAGFNYDLPRGKIAQRPKGLSGSRASSLLLHAALKTGGLAIADRHFADLAGLLAPGDLVLLNDSQVLPCRFFVPSGQGEIELLLLLGGESAATDGCFRCHALARPMRKLRQDQLLCLGEGLQVLVLGRTSDERRLIVEVSTADSAQRAIDLVVKNALMPIPPYIRKGHADELDRNLYQTVYAKNPGSVAAPTAGLHFTPELLEELGARGIKHAFVTLHVGPASFLSVDDQAAMPGVSVERYIIPPAAGEAIAAAKARGGRVVAVGTTTVRALESAAVSGKLCAGDETHETSLIIRPGFNFRIVDALITNFHQPGSSHLLLVSAFLGTGNMQRIYHHALAGEYRFLSYGDAMLIER